jgi:GntR family transcriptional repressor for pyruvate dehydrogenase complex
MDTGALRRVDRANAYELVRCQLLELVQSGSLEVGSRLPSEATLAKTMQVSRPVIREAIGSLRALGMIESRSGSGNYVTATRPSLLSGRISIEEVHEARLELEVPIARIAARRHSYESAVELDRVIDSMALTTDQHTWVELDAEFHILLARASGNRMLTEFSEHIRASISALSTFVLSPARMRAVNDEHRCIRNAVIARDEQAAAEAMKSHLLAAQRAAISRYGEDSIAQPLES